MNACACGCGAEVRRRWVKGHQNIGKRGPGTTGWKGGRGILSGYVRVWAPDHPRTSLGYVFEHIIVAEAALGRYLPPAAVIHHVDENKQRNVGGNLVICPDNAYHQLLHRRQRALSACGDANALRCHICHTYERQSEVVTLEGVSGGKPYKQTFHRDCASRRTAEAKVKRRLAIAGCEHEERRVS